MAPSSKDLEKIYRKYLVPRPLEYWATGASLQQPSLLKQVPTKNICSTSEYRHESIPV